MSNSEELWNNLSRSNSSTRCTAGSTNGSPSPAGASAALQLACLALVVLWRSRPHSVLDVWLMVECANWVFDVALSAVFNAARFDLGFYFGRLYGLLAALFILGVLMYEMISGERPSVDIGLMSPDRYA